MKAYFDEGNRLENYLQEGTLYCREERQFAALLYSVFLKKREKGKMPADQKTEEIVKACLGSNDIIIEDVYFEATLMSLNYSYQLSRKCYKSHHYYILSDCCFSSYK